MIAVYEISLLDDDGVTLATNIVKRKLPDSTDDETARDIGVAIALDRVKLAWWVEED